MYIYLSLWKNFCCPNQTKTKSIVTQLENIKIIKISFIFYFFSTIIVTAYISKHPPHGATLFTRKNKNNRNYFSFSHDIGCIVIFDIIRSILNLSDTEQRFIYCGKYILQITQPSQYRYNQLQYRFAVISEEPSI